MTRHWLLITIIGLIAIPGSGMIISAHTPIRDHRSRDPKPCNPMSPGSRQAPCNGRCDSVPRPCT